MKLFFALIILCSFAANADEYKDPEIKLGLHPHSEPTIKGDTKWEEDSFRVQETQEKDRALASEDDQEDESTMLGRNPSSKKGELAPEVQFWKWDNK